MFSHGQSDEIRFNVALVFLSGFFAAWFSTGVVWSEPPNLEVAQSGTAVVSAPVLLDRFDRNGDGKLNAREKETLRAAFGDVDIPMLPPKPYRYALPEPAQVSHLHATDNTPDDNPITDAGATLGRVLFYDTSMSLNGTVACASCHIQKKAFSDPQRVSVGFEGGKTARNAMSLANLRFSNLGGSRPGFFWDERAATLEEQALMPIQDPVEMGMTLTDLEQKLQKLAYYPPLFKAAFDTQEVTSGLISKAIAQFMRSMLSFDSKFDQGAKAAGDHVKSFANFTEEENLGKSLFIEGVGGVGEFGCAHCHIPPTFNMPKSFNNGLDLRYKDRGLGARSLRSNDPFSPSNDGKFKASSLRNIALTAPYMHDGRFANLEEVINHYSDGVHPHENLGLAFSEDQSDGTEGTSGFRLSDGQKAALIAFLKTLTDEKFISDPRFSDPFVRLNATGESHRKNP